MADPGSSSLSEEPLPPLEGQIFTSGQRQFYDVLAARDNRLADMYLGGLTVLAQVGNPDRIPQAAHSIRELIEKLPRHLGFVVQNNPVPLGQMTRNLADVWDKMEISVDGSSNSSCIPTTFVGRLQNFFDDFRNSNPKLRERGKSVLNNLDPSEMQLPEVVQEARVDSWKEFNDYFVSVSHHRTSQDMNDFIEMLEKFEAFLLDYLRPRAAENQAEILRLIQEAEGQGNGHS